MKALSHKITTATLGTVFILLVACDIRQPTVEANYASVSFRHSGTETTCLACHTSDRPAPINSFTHYNDGDCISCHIAGSVWSDHSFHTHNSTPASCSSCHEKDRKPPASGVTHGNGADCIGCHTVSSNWSSGASPHSPTPTSCNSCHTGDRPSPVNGIVHYNGEDCVSCHVPGGIWGNYKLYSHTPVSTTCNQCHENNRPALSNHPSQNNSAVTDKRHYISKDCSICHKTPTTNRIFTFAHTNYQGTKINFCLPCHYTKGWSKHGSSGSVSFSGDGNCYSCHNKGKSWDR